MRVPLNKAGHEHLALEIDDARAGSNERLHRTIRSDRNNLASVDRHGFRPRMC